MVRNVGQHAGQDAGVLVGQDILGTEQTTNTVAGWLWCRKCSLHQQIVQILP